MLLAGGTHDWALIGWLLVGAIAMRGAGCVYNDIVDADLDRQVARTASRPVASGRVSKRVALAWALALCLAGLVVLLQLRWQAQLVALGSVALVAAYPFMKRITGWPQAWLGLVFTWGAPVGWVAVRSAQSDWRPGVLAVLYAGSVCWCIGYDTIYALQDREDDALVGIGSSALSLGRHVRTGLWGFYGAALALWALAFWLLRPDPVALLALSLVLALVPPVAFEAPPVMSPMHLGWQALTLRPGQDGNALARFRANRFAGLLLALACWAVGRVG